MADNSYQSNTYFEQDTQNFVVKSGAKFGRIGGATITVGAEASNTINVAIQLTDPAGDDLDASGSVLAYLSDNSDGSTLAGTAPAGTVAIGTDGLAIELVTKKVWQFVSESDGDIDLDIGETGTDTWYLVVVLPSGELAISDAITFA